MTSPLNKVVFIQKVAAFASTSLDHIIKLAYVNDSWSDTVKNYSFHVFEERVRDETKDTCEKVFKRALEGDVIWLLNVLLSKKSCFGRIKCHLIVSNGCSTSLSTTKFVLDKIVEVGGTQLLENLLAETDEQGMTFLMLTCIYCSSTEVMNVVFSKIVEAGGPQFLKKQLAATDNFGQSGLMLCCRYYASPQVVKLVFEKTVEVGGIEMLKSQLDAAEDVFGRNCLMRACFDSSSPEVVKFIVVVLFCFGLFQQQYLKLDPSDKQHLRTKAEIKDASWTPDDESIAEIKTIIAEKEMRI